MSCSAGWSKMGKSSALAGAATIFPPKETDRLDRKKDQQAKPLISLIKLAIFPICPIFPDGQHNHVFRSPYWDASPMAQTLIRDVMRVLAPDRPIMQLARLAGRPRATAKSWATGHRRPPIYVLAMIREVMRDRPWTGQELELDYEIRNREREPKFLTGFNEIKER